MNTKLIVGLAALLLAVPTGLAATHNFSRDSIGPTTVNIAAVGEFGIAVCDNGQVGAVVTQIACGTGGVGAIVDVSAMNADRTATFGHFASGSCTITGSGAIAPANGDFSASCGVDRDNDGFVTNVDLSNTAVGDANTGSTDDEGWDDDFAGDNGNAAASDAADIAVCFRADVTGSASASGAAWDDVSVFIAVNVPSTTVAAGTFDVDIELTTVTDGSCNASSHDDGEWS